MSESSTKNEPTAKPVEKAKVTSILIDGRREPDSRRVIADGDIPRRLASSAFE